MSNLNQTKMNKLNKTILVVASILFAITANAQNKSTVNYGANNHFTAKSSNNMVSNYDTDFRDNDIILYIEDLPEDLVLCLEHNQKVIVNAEEGCYTNQWYVNGHWFIDQNYIIIEPEIGTKIIEYSGCNLWHYFSISYFDSAVPNTFTHILWKRQGEMELIEALGADTLLLWPNSYDFLWNTGATTNEIEVYETGTYICEITGVCGSSTRTFIVRDNVEIVSTSVNPNTNKNLVTWETIPEQAEYISNVIVNCDDIDIATIPYTDGHFLDNIGSELAAHIYKLKCIDIDGIQCPIDSYQRGTIHMAFTPDINGNVEMTWNQPELSGANIHVGRFEICEYDPYDNEISVIDSVNSVTTSYSCNQNMFDYGYPLIRAVIQDGRGEKDLLSNRTEELVGLNEIVTGTNNVYPNPFNGEVRITAAQAVDGAANIVVYNVLGEQVYSKAINCTETHDFTIDGSAWKPGVYFYSISTENGVLQGKIVKE
jgi:hypothetical protein